MDVLGYAYFLTTVGKNESEQPAFHIVRIFHVLYSDAELNPKIKICICVKADMLGRAEDQQA